MSGVTTDRILERLPAELGAINALGLLPLPFSIAIYIAFSIDLSLSEWSAFGAVLVAVTGAGWLLSAGMIRRGNAAIVQHLQARAERGADEAMALDAGVAYQASLTLPQRAQRSILIVSFLPVLVAPPALWLLGYEGWLAGSRVVSLLVAALGSSLITSTLAFYRARQSLTFLCSGLARGVGDPEARAQFGNRPSLYRRTQFAVAIPASVILLLAVQVVYQDVRRRAEDEALSWAARAVQAVAEGDLALSVEERVRQQLPPRRFWPVPLSVFEIRAGRVADAFPEPLSKSFLVALDRALGRAEHAGRIAPPAANEVGAYHRSEDGSMLVARVARVDLEDRYAAMNWSIALLVLVLSSVPLLVGRFVARDLASGIDSLRLMLDRMASGDLRPGEGFESDDELGALSRSLEMMGNSLRETVCRMASTAEHIDGVSAGIAAMATEVAGTSADQLQKIQHVDRLMDEINERVAGASQSAAAVTGTIDESSQSVLELGAAGDELNETASLLTSKVDAVSDSLEQMMCSVKRVGATTDRLAEASEETSSSMEEMASAMRGVDTSAETTANLSRDVVDKAELGQAKVVQTIAGMEAIREATDVAESVIRGLGARTSEIGGILDVIDDVADETNLLALNA
ncbi:MAG: hypothetical protein CL908_12950, partial [Deltaproteobacteria bacterium]|nr:hypothetical protein [Deltaproteobacteria bacterium]